MKDRLLKLTLDILVAAFVLLEDLANKGIAWCDEHYPVPPGVDVDEMVVAIEEIHRQLMADASIMRQENVVHLPRLPSRRMH